MRSSVLGSWLFTRPLDDDFARLWRLIKENPDTVVLILGIFLRLIVYLGDREFWMDEASLFGNLAGKRIFDFSEPLGGDQLAPPLFLIVQRALMSLLGTSRYVSRLLPLACGIASVVLFSRLARRILAPRPALIALILFAFSDDLIYYSSELKPYSLDLAIGLAISLAAIDAVGKPAWGRRAETLAILAVTAPWCSFASAFVVAGCGATLVMVSLLTSRWRDAGVWMVIGIGWLTSLSVSYQTSAVLLSPYTTMYRFWDFAFLPVWPLPLDRSRLAAAVGILLEIFVNPLNLAGPLWPRVVVVLPVALFLLGAVALARQSWPACAILVLPIAMAMVASAMKKYPLHGRLILELVPAFFLLIAQGTEWLRGLEKGRIKLGYITVLVVLLTFPCLTAFQNSAFSFIRDFNSHGDIRRNIFMK